MTRQEMLVEASSAFARVIKDEIVQQVLSEFASNMNFYRVGLPEYGLNKIAWHIALAMYSDMRDVPFSYFTMTPEEIEEFHANYLGADN